MDFADVIHSRRSTRSYEPRGIDREVIERILESAVLAPSARNSQPWRFHVAVGEPRARVGEIMAQTTVHLAEYLDVMAPEDAQTIALWYSTLGDAPVVIGVSSLQTEPMVDEKDTMLSVGCALQILLLAATNEGLGACVITSARWVTDELKSALGVERERSLVSLVAIGHPADTLPPQPPRRVDNTDWVE